MKKILAILFSIFYFGFSSGAAFSIHYCMKEFVSVSQKVDDICGKCGVKDKKGCCKTEIKIVKVDDSQKSDYLNVDFLSAVSEIPVKDQFSVVDKSFSATKFTQIQINAPPEYRLVPIYINHCNFRI
ncbi:HYC_CC_PP family protein [Chryseobacterium indologenes]|uniref:HYC_CC_PP family protein n=1 Tax=Chryseobacterium indologenes TaxID=253 RepID=UPI0040598034